MFAFGEGNGKISPVEQAIIERALAGVNRQTMIKDFIKMLLGTLVLFLLLEGVCLVAGVPYGASHFVEKIVITEKFGTRKPPGEYRIFAFGESTMQGSQYAPRSNPARWLEAYLKDFLPDKKIRVVNFARMGRGSDFTADTFSQTLQYKPDLAVFYLGHNDFLHQNRHYEVKDAKKSFQSFARRLVMKSRVISQSSRWVLERRLRRKADRPDDSIEYDTIETPPRGIGEENKSVRTEPGYWDNLDFFRSNFIRILDTAEKYHVKVLFYESVCNLKDFAPWLSVHIKHLTPEQLETWTRLFEEGKVKQAQSSFVEALDLFRQAYVIDDTYAELSFRMGEICFKTGELADAKRYFEEARDNDAIIFRANKDTLTIMKQLEKEKGFPYLDTEKILVSEVPGGILGEPIIEDNVHFSIKGQSLVAKAAAQEIADRGWIAPRTEWKFDRERSFDEISKEFGIDGSFLVASYLKLVSYFGSRFENRVRFAQKALELEPANSRALRHLAWTYWLMGDKKRAVEVYQKLRQLDPGALEEVFKAQPEIKKIFEALP